MKKIKIRKLGNILTKFLYGGVIVMLLSLAGVMGASVLGLPNGIRLYSVQSGSMTPTIPIGSLIVVQTDQNYEIGDIVTFRTEENRESKNPDRTITHRLVGKQITDSGEFYLTKGDANESADATPIDPTLVIGKVRVFVPILGKPIVFARTELGFVTMIIIPATIVIFSEVLVIKNEVAKLINKRRKNEKSK